uniref:Rad60/SUMO-like domain-containing protein n=1 Tax=Takifugu rubripes TaxID=31033 RepID=A0A3B5KIU9_TAKRU
KRPVLVQNVLSWQQRTGVMSSLCIQEKVCFRFDGSRVLCSQTPAQLDMEDGDIIEVWTGSFSCSIMAAAKVS